MDISKGDLTVGMMAAAALIWQMPNIQAKQAEQAASVASARIDMLAQDKVAANKIILDESAKCAEDRYAKGVEVVSTLDMANAAPIVEGGPVIAGAYAKKFNPAKPDRGMYLARNTIVGDAYGTTAVLRFDPEKGYAVAADICTTPNREKMQLAMKQRPGMNRPGTGQ
jgi:hypothetical protein